MRNQVQTFLYLLTFFLIAGFILFYYQSPSLSQNEPVNQEIISEDGEPILVGQLDRDAWQKKAYREWFANEYEDYVVDEATLANIKPTTESIDIMVFLGTWCSDSQREVPRFYKVLEALDFDEDRLLVVGLDNHPDRYKQSPQHEEAGWEIEFVPTIILLQDGHELGRIVETPRLSLERDLAEILNNELAIAL